MRATRIMGDVGFRLTALALLALAAGAGPSNKAPEPTWSDAQRQHWSFLPPKRPSVPPVKQSAWVRNPIDAFILSEIEAVDLEPAREADRRTLIRRLTFDLTGLPPTPEEVD